MKRLYSETKKKPFGRRKRRIIQKKSNLNQMIGKTSLKELKCVDFTDSARTLVVRNSVVGAANLATGMTVLNLAQQGTGFYNRIGTKIVMRQIQINFVVKSNLGDAPTFGDTALYRAMLIYDKVPSFSAGVTIYPIIDDIMYGDDQTGGSSTNFFTGISVPQGKRFVVLRNKVFKMDPASNWCSNVKWVIKRKLPTEFRTTSNPCTIADVSLGALYFVIFAISLGGGDAPILSLINSRIRYDD